MSPWAWDQNYYMIICDTDLNVCPTFEMCPHVDMKNFFSVHTCIHVHEKFGSEKLCDVPRTPGWLKCRVRPVCPGSEYCIQFAPTSASYSTFIF